jgi:hypothetical protein
LRTEISPVPVRTQGPDGSWSAVDYTLSANGRGVAPVNSPADVVFSSGGAGPVVTYTRGKHVVKMSWGTSALPAPVVQGATATYKLTDTQSLVLTATSDGFEQSLVYSAAPTTAPKLRLTFETSDLSVEANDQGGAGFIDAKGKVVFTIPAPVMHSAAWDKAAEEWTQTQRVKTTVTQGKGQIAYVDLEPSMSFLTDPATVYPATVDPTISSVSQYGDTYVVQADNSDHSSDYDLRIGMNTSGKLRRSLLRFNTAAALSGMHVTSATLNLYNTFSGTCVAAPVYAYPITSAYTLNTVNWSTQPTINTSAS